MLRPLIATFCLLAAPAFAEDAVLTIAQDRYQAGTSVRFDGAAVQDLFMAGNRVVVAAPISGSAHLAGRRVAVDAARSMLFPSEERCANRLLRARWPVHKA